MSKPVTSMLKSRPSSESSLTRGQQAIVPGRDLGHAVAGNPERTGLRRGEVIEAERRHLGPGEPTTGQQPAVTRDRILFAADQNRHIGAESPDPVGDLSDLPACYAGAGFAGVRLQLIDAT